MLNAAGGRPQGSHAAAVELSVASVKRSSAACRILGTRRLATLHLRHRTDVVPGEIAVVKTAIQWTRAGRLHVSGDILSTRVEASALGVRRLRLKRQGVWNPAREYWGERDQPIEEWAKPIIARGPRPEFEMQQVLPGEEEQGDPFDDPIIEAVEWKESGHYAEAYNALMRLCQADLRCLDAHAHLGNLVFDRDPKRAIRHYEVGVRIADWSVGETFDSLLPWGFIDNRPFLRCMQGYGLCLWRLRHFEEAECVFRRMLWLNPTDNQGMRFLIHPVRARKQWRSH